MRPEEKVEADTCKLAYQLLGVESNKFVAVGERGAPDRVFWLPGGVALFIEFKAPGVTELAPKQIEFHAKLTKLGYRIQVHNDTRDALDAIITAMDTPQVPKKGREILTRARRRCAVLFPRTG